MDPLTPPILRVENLHHSYDAGSGKEPVRALRGVNLTIHAGEYVVILGHNGSGKSTLARHLNALLLPSEGDVWVRDWNTREKAHLREIRTTVGMVFQSPDNQIVATIVEEDVAFGPENLGMPHAEMVQRVDWALGQVDMLPMRKRAPHLLSGGQKQRVAVAGVIAMQPSVLVLDEATAMLDPLGRREVLAIAHRLHREQGTTVVAITHFMGEAVDADRVVVMAEGQVVIDGTPREVFAQRERLRELHLDVPPVSQVAAQLHARLPEFPAALLTAGEMVEAVRALRPDDAAQPPARAAAPAAEAAPAEALISVEQLVHFYMRGTPLEVQALHDVSLSLRPGEILGIMGHTGSGKSTVIQHLNGLLRPHGGRVRILGQDPGNPATDLRTIRRRVGLVFQFPEAQLFEQYVGDDVAFGPRNLGLGREEVRERVRRAMETVELGFEDFKDRMTHALSGGQRRRVALAGVLALEPEVLVLDEPTAGLDPQGRRKLLANILDYHAQGRSLVLVSHNMEELAQVCDRIVVIAHGRTVLEGPPARLFADAAGLRTLGLDVPDVTALGEALADAGLLPPGTLTTVDEAVEAIGALLGV